jgi:hypothetical protein
MAQLRGDEKLPKPSVQPMRTCPDNATPEPDTCSQAMCRVLSIDSAAQQALAFGGQDEAVGARLFEQQGTQRLPELMRRDTVV